MRIYGTAVIHWKEIMYNKCAHSKNTAQQNQKKKGIIY